jgi:hypothetical protein
MIEGTITFLPSRDLDAIDAFFNALEIPMVLDQGDCRIYRIGEAAYWGFCKHLNEVPQPASAVVLTLLVDDVVAWHARCQENGLPADGPARVNERFGIEHFFVVMPDGYRLEVQRFLDPNWATT